MDPPVDPPLKGGHKECKKCKQEFGNKQKQHTWIINGYGLLEHHT